MNNSRTVAITGVLAGMLSSAAWAHCDGLDGPVVTAARRALEAGNVNLVLIWIQPRDEAEIRAAFDRTLVVRKLSPEAKELADMYFFETLVRVHRAGEGAAYTGLKPAGRDLGPAIPAADEALRTGELSPLKRLLIEALERGLHQRFEQVLHTRSYSPQDVSAGRIYVRAYVSFLHYVEGLYEAAARTPDAHEHEEKPLAERAAHHD